MHSKIGDFLLRHKRWSLTFCKAGFEDRSVSVGENPAFTFIFISLRDGGRFGNEAWLPTWLNSCTQTALLVASKTFLFDSRGGWSKKGTAPPTSLCPQLPAFLPATSPEAGTGCQRLPPKSQSRLCITQQSKRMRAKLELAGSPCLSSCSPSKFPLANDCWLIVEGSSLQGLFETFTS